MAINIPTHLTVANPSGPITPGIAYTGGTPNFNESTGTYNTPPAQLTPADFQQSIREQDNTTFRNSTINGAGGGMGAITNPSTLFPAIANGWGGSTAVPAQGSGGKGGLTDIVSAQAAQATQMAQGGTGSMFNYQPASSLLGGTGNRPGQPYVYGNLGPTSSDYNIWGSKGNPYAYGPGYNPGTRYASPIVPQPLTPTAPSIDGGGDNSPVAPWRDPSLNPDGTPRMGSDGTPYDPKFDDPAWQNSKVLGQLSPGLGLAYGLVNGRIDAPYGDGYARLPWYEGSAGNGYGYTDQGYDKFAPGDVDRGIYDASTGERAWDDSFDDYNTNDQWAETGLFEGMGNIFGGRTWDGLEQPTGAPVTFANKNSVEAVQSRANIATEKQRVATNIAINNTKAEAARVAAENPAQAAADTAYVGSSDDGYAATAARHGTVPGSEQTAMLAEQDMGMSDSGGGSSDDGGGGWSGSDAASDMDADSGWSGADSDFSDSGGGDSGGGGGGSYIATAATNALGEEGLTIFEEWRDYMFDALPTFTTSYGRYRVTAPKIVAAIDMKDNSKELYQDIWNEYLKPIFSIITEDRDNPKALSDYKVMVKELTNKYLKGDK